ncbi:MAG: hypothetical protein IPK63_16525 [Candidatus Competibacteraceae bacterium]|nr:hypothetical protein [Candidatus Competibacteraceae bacterium]
MAKRCRDGRTAYPGDDGAYVRMTMFMADQYGDWSAWHLYTANGIRPAIRTGGKANITWIRLGHATDAEIGALANSLDLQ